MRWSPQQAAALDAVAAWMRDPARQVFVLHGYAGTGKTELAKHFASGLSNVFFCAYTGKAALVLKERGCPEARTVHSLFYSALGDDQQIAMLRKKIEGCAADDDRRRQMLEFELAQLLEKAARPRFAFNPETPAKEADLLVIDEGSMIDGRMADDILSVCRKVLFIGDPAQLPPVRGEGYFMTIAPDALLTEIHRQALDNPILRWATVAREGGEPEFGDLGRAKKIRKADSHMADFTGADQVICWMNRTRRTINLNMRRALGIESDYPIKGDRVICLRNNRELGLLNGLQGAATAGWTNGADKLVAHVAMDGGVDHADLPVWKDAFDAHRTGVVPPRSFFERTEAEEFDWGYAITCHKAQGSQWRRVVIADDGAGRQQGDRSRWLYTAITRAQEELLIVS